MLETLRCSVPHTTAQRFLPQRALPLRAKAPLDRALVGCAGASNPGLSSCSPLVDFDRLLELADSWRHQSHRSRFATPPNEGLPFVVPRAFREIPIRGRAPDGGMNSCIPVSRIRRVRERPKL